MSVPDRRIIVFAKWPEPGAVKTRLGASIGMEAAAEVARAFLLDVVATASEVADLTSPARRGGGGGAARVALAARAERGQPQIGMWPTSFARSASDLVRPLRTALVLAYAPRGARAKFRGILPAGWGLRLQRGEDLGARLADALNGVSPSLPTVILGMDSPWLMGEHLGAAFAALEQSDCVLGPCRDGGYYLIGLRPGVPSSIFAGVRWSSERTCADQLAAIRAAGLTCALLPEGYDVDTREDLERLEADLVGYPPEALPHTRWLLTRKAPG